MKYAGNIREINSLRPDYMGFIFYKGSKRFAGNELEAEDIRNIKGMSKVGVFVNETSARIIEICSKFDFDFAQLHGSESPEDCRFLKERGIKIIKVFLIGKDFDFSLLEKYDDTADFYLFDTATEGHGGSGKKFNWEILKEYRSGKPYFLSGGISPEDAKEILRLKDERIHAVDINSCFETEPGLKNPEQVKKFISVIRRNNIGDS